MIRPRRSLLFMPGSNARALEKARNLPADGIILDLEDSVAPDAKAMARDQIAKAIAAGGFGKREVLIRVNAWIRRGGSTTSPWPARRGPTAFWFRRFPAWRISTPSPIASSDINADTSIRVWAMIETARAVLHAEELAAASRDSETRLAGFVFGPNDISRETRIRMQPGRAAMIPMITHCILATRAHGLEILDGPYSDISNIDGFARRMRARPRSRLRRQDADPSGPDRGLQRDLHAAGRGGRACPQDHRGVRAAGERLARRDPARRPDGGAAARRYGQAHDRDCGRDRGDGELASGLRFSSLRPAGDNDGLKPEIAPPPRHKGCREPASGRRGLSAKYAAR